MAETNQETDTLSHHVTDVGVPGEVTVKQDTQVFNKASLLDCLATPER